MRFAERCVPAVPGSAGAVLRRWAPSRRRTRVGFARGCSPTASGPDRPRPPHCGSRSRRCWSPARPASTGNRRRRQRGSAPLRPAPRRIVSRTHTKKRTRNLFVLKPKAGRGCGAPPQRHRGRRAHLRAPLRPRAAHRRSRHRRFFGGRSRSPRLPKGNFEIRFAALKPSLKTSVLSK